MSLTFLVFSRYISLFDIFKPSRGIVLALPVFGLVFISFSYVEAEKIFSSTLLSHSGWSKNQIEVVTGENQISLQICIWGIHINMRDSEDSKVK